MARNEFPAPDVSDFVVQVSAITLSTRQRILNTVASNAEGSVVARKTVGILHASYQGLATRSDPFTVDTFGPRFRRCSTRLWDDLAEPFKKALSIF